MNEAIAVLMDELLPRCTIVTPNVPEAASIEEMHQTLDAMVKLGASGGR